MDLGDVDEIDVEAIGEPGQRTFRLLAERAESTASLWIEKEQLQALGLLLERQVAHYGRRAPVERPLLTLAGRFPSPASIDFKVGRMALGFDEETARFILTAHDTSEPEQTAPTFSCRATASQARALSAKIGEVVAAGRPLCPLCGAPMEGKHVCPLSNGHVQ